MKIRRHKSFDKQYRNLKPAQQKRLKKTLELFVVNPSHPDLYNHALIGERKGFNSIAFGGDWRAHYREMDGVATFVACGTYSQLYK